MTLRRSSSSGRVTAGAAVAVALLVAGCGSAGVATATEGASASASSGTPSASPASPSSTGRADRIDVTRLPDGPPPKVDTLVGWTLFHDGKAIPLDRTGDSSGAQALGSLDGTAYISNHLTNGDQLYRVGDDGSLTAVGTPHESYDAFPRMSSATGHVFFQYDDRGSGKTTVTVMDARTGDVLTVLHDRDDDSRIDPADRPIVDAMRYRDRGGAVLALSPDGTTALGVEPYQGLDLPKATVLEQWSLGPKPSVVRRLSFPIADPGDEDMTVDSVVFEDDDTFLVRAYLPRASGVAPIRVFVVRCTLEGACERATKSAANVSIAGVGGVLIPGRFPDS